jgi:hypothetical protein
MGRPRKIDVETPIVQGKSDEWKFYFAAAMSGLIARGGMAMDQLMRTCKEYADQAEEATKR